MRLPIVGGIRSRVETTMLVQCLDHFTLRTSELDATVAFFESVAGLRVGPRPAFAFDGAWLYSGATAVVHLAAVDPADSELHRYLGARDAGPGSGSVDHIAFRCKGLPAFERVLAAQGRPYTPRTVPGLHEHQVFVTDPNGVRIEFIFSADESATWLTDGSGVATGPSEVAP
jgi:catechol 2,3-dioxygenase-like lactoylglutathione lyase family enzyme